MESRPFNRLASALLAIAVLGTTQAAAQGKLDAFAADASAGKKHHPGETPHSESCLAYAVDEVLVDLFEVALLHGGATSLQRVSDLGLSDPGVAPRAIGDPLIPFARIDAGYQAVESDIKAVDVRGELGYGPVGVHVDLTRYREENPPDNLDLVRTLGLYRMSFGSYLEMDLGFGALTLRGDETTSMFLFSLPILVHPDKRWGIEFRPAWAERVRDYDVAVLLSRGFASLKFGYRWIGSPGESLAGPYAGLSLRL